jgi:TIR domain
MGNHVFISYAHEDQRFVNHLATILKEQGIFVWLDHSDIPGGTYFRREIERAICGCTHFLIILSPAAVTSDFVMGEFQMARREKKTIVPVLYRACNRPFELWEVHYVDCTGRGLDDDEALSKLMRALGRSVNRPMIPKTSRLWQCYVAGKKVVSSRLRLYGVVGSVLGGLLIGGLWYIVPLSPVEPTRLSSALSLPPGKGPEPPRLVEPRKVLVRVSTQPTGFEVHQDGRPIVKTPWQFYAPVGQDISAVLKREGYIDEKVGFKVREVENDYPYWPKKSSKP